MKFGNIFTIAIAATATLFMTSCKKEVPVKTPIEQLSEQTNYMVDDISYENADVLPIVTWQFGSNQQNPSILELHVNDLNTSVVNSATSALRPAKTGQQRILNIVQTSANSCAISFDETNPGYAGSYDEGAKQPIQSLLEKQVLDYHGGGGKESWWSFSCAKLSGVYFVEETTDGFRLKRNDGKVVMNLNRTLRD